MQQYSPRGFRVLPPVVKNLLIINTLFFLATLAMANYGIDLVRVFGLHYPGAPDFKVHQLVTYMFMHGGFEHILFNMFALWMFGNVLENVWGGRRFLAFYLVTGIGAGLTYIIWIHFEIAPVINGLDHVIANPTLQNLFSFNNYHKFEISQYSGAIWGHFKQFEQAVTTLQYDPQNHAAVQEMINFLSEYKNYLLNQQVVVGASGAVFGILLAFGMMFPDTLIYLYFAIPIKAKWFVLGYGALELISGVMNRPGDNVAHFAHLGGMIFGYFMIVYWKKKGKLY